MSFSFEKHYSVYHWRTTTSSMVVTVFIDVKSVCVCVFFGEPFEWSETAREWDLEWMAMERKGIKIENKKMRICGLTPFVFVRSKALKTRFNQSSSCCVAFFMQSNIQMRLIHIPFAHVCLATFLFLAYCVKCIALS